MSMAVTFGPPPEESPYPDWESTILVDGKPSRFELQIQDWPYTAYILMDTETGHNAPAWDCRRLGTREQVQQAVLEDWTEFEEFFAEAMDDPHCEQELARELAEIG